MLNHKRVVLAHVTQAPGEFEPDVIESLYRAARDPLMWPEALSELATHTGAETAMVARYDPARGASCVSGSALAGQAVDTSDVSASIRHIAQQISRRFATAAGASRDAGGLSQILWMPGPEACAGEQMHAILPHPALCDTGRAAWIGITLEHTTPPQRERVAQRLMALRGHLLCALDIALELAGTRQAAGATVTVLGALPSAALTLDASGRVVHANTAARALLHDRNGVFETADRRLRASIERDDKQLTVAIHAALAGDRGEPIVAAREVLRVRRSAGASPLLLILDSIPAPNRSPLPDQTSVLLVRLINEEPAPDGRLYPLHAAFGLTAAETRIAGSIASGHSPAVVARQLDLSTNTVRTHLARIFDKTGTRSQHALTRLLAAIGSWPLQ